jgi:hypothetical protein
MRIFILLIFTVAFLSTSVNAQFGKLLDKAKESATALKKTGDTSGLDISGGLKEALEKGTLEAVSSLSAKDGYLKSPYKIEIPSEAQKVVSKLKMVPGFQDVEANLTTKMNEAAEIAAKKAAPIFVNAIKQMSFSDAKNILFGEENAATQYLTKTSKAALYAEFMPVIQASLDEVNARTYWKSAVDKYNAIPFSKDMNPDLDDHVNNKALEGMFGLIAKKELGIRKDVDQRSSPLLKDVFGQLD